MDQRYRLTPAENILQENNFFHFQSVILKACACGCVRVCLDECANLCVWLRLEGEGERELVKSKEEKEGSKRKLGRGKLREEKREVIEREGEGEG